MPQCITTETKPYKLFSFALFSIAERRTLKDQRSVEVATTSCLSNTLTCHVSYSDNKFGCYFLELRMG